jgi:GNAT superfamily N-acetyltransferase
MDAVEKRCSRSTEPALLVEFGVDFVELKRPEDALTDEIRERARTGSTNHYTEQYSVRESGAEVAYVALDWLPMDYCSNLVLYEMFVPNQHRHQGIGTRILAETVRLAKNRGRSGVFLMAHPLEDYPPEKLVRWYEMQGFTRDLGDGRAEAMVKDVS